MKLLTFYSDDYKKLYDDFFLPSYNKHLKDDFELIVKHVDNNSTYVQDNFFLNLTYEKLLHITSTIEVPDYDNLTEEEISNVEEQIMVFSDCDVQFFKNFANDLKQELGNYNIKFQDNIIEMCGGFFICKENEETLHFFKILLNKIGENVINGELKDNISEQSLLNDMIAEGKYNKISKLDKDKYFSVVASNHGLKKWIGEVFNVPSNIVLHHANWTDGVTNKYNMLDYVKKQIEL